MKERNYEKIIKIPDDALILMVGPSSSGKTTFVSTWFPQHVIIHSDEFRVRTCDDANIMSATEDAFDVMSLLAEKRISRGLLTVIDALNVTKKFREYFVKHAIRYNRPIYAIIMMTTLAKTENRHKERTNRPYDVEILRKQHINLKISIVELKNDKNVKVVKIYPKSVVKITLTQQNDLKYEFSHKIQKRNNIYATSAIILNAGLGKKWGNYLGIPKQLIKIGSETILERTVRMARQMGIDDITSVTHNENLVIRGCRYYEPKSNRWTVETLLSSSELWTEWTLVLLGDVFFTPTAIQSICMSKKDIQFLGRSSMNKYNGRKLGEIFALKFNIIKRKVIQEAAMKVIAQCEGKALGNIWDLYHTIAGLPIRTYENVENELFLEVHDFTDDFDRPKDYKRSIDVYEKYVELEQKWTEFSIKDI